MKPGPERSMTDGRKEKPAHLGLQYAEQFKDSSVAGAYAARPPYADETISIIEDLPLRRPHRLGSLGVDLALSESGRPGDKR